MIIAVDFDGILAQTNVPFPQIGTPNYRMLEFVGNLIQDGHEVILWTSRTGAALNDALTWCYRYGLEFCAVNDQASSNKLKYSHIYPQGTRKVNADIYLDDHSPDFILDSRVNGNFNAICNLINKVKEIIDTWQEEN